MSLTRWLRSAAIARSFAIWLTGNRTDLTTVFSPYFNASGLLGRLIFLFSSIVFAIKLVFLPSPALCPARGTFYRLRAKGAEFGGYLCVMAISVYRRAVKSKNICLTSSHCTFQRSLIRVAILSIFAAVSFVGRSGLR